MQHRAVINRSRSSTTGAHGEPRRSLRRRRLFQNLILESDAFRIVLLEPLFCGIHICEYLDVVFVADLLARVDVNENSHWSLFSLRRLRQSRNYVVRIASMASQAFSASAYVLKGDPPTLIAGLLIWIGR